jgi:plasmid maintenance system killer protein
MEKAAFIQSLTLKLFRTKKLKGTAPSNIGNLKGYYSIRINSQWRIVFRWESNAAHDVQIMDYHK